MVHDPLEKFLMVNKFPEKIVTGRGWGQKETHSSSTCMSWENSFFLCCKNALDMITFLFHITVKPRYLVTI